VFRVRSSLTPPALQFGWPEQIDKRHFGTAPYRNSPLPIAEAAEAKCRRPSPECRREPDRQANVRNGWKADIHSSDADARSRGRNGCRLHPNDVQLQES
jgi:hypothetical protein